LKNQWGISPQFLPENEKTTDEAGLPQFLLVPLVLENQLSNGQDIG
jgi:hypothetical protein